MTTRSTPETIQEGLSNGTFVLAAHLEDEFQAQLVEQALTEDEIPHVIRHSRETAWSFLFTPQVGWGAIVCRVEDVGRVRVIVDQLEQSDGDAEREITNSDQRISEEEA